MHGLWYPGYKFSNKLLKTIQVPPFSKICNAGEMQTRKDSCLWFPVTSSQIKYNLTEFFPLKKVQIEQRRKEESNGQGYFVI